jgi:hypothetical protein
MMRYFEIILDDFSVESVAHFSSFERRVNLNDLSLLLYSSCSSLALASDMAGAGAHSKGNLLNGIGNGNDVRVVTNDIHTDPRDQTPLRALSSTSAATVFSTRSVAGIIPANEGARTRFHPDICLPSKQSNSAACACYAATWLNVPRAGIYTFRLSNRRLKDSS